MVGGTTANDLATCELKVMKQKGNSNSKSNSQTFLLKEEGDRAWVARWEAFPAGRISALRVGLDSATVVIDGMTNLAEPAGRKMV